MKQHQTFFAVFLFLGLGIFLPACQNASQCQGESCIADGSNEGDFDTPVVPVEPDEPSQPRQPDSTTEPDPGFDAFQQVGYPSALAVDGQYNKYRALMEGRIPRPTEFPTDHCDPKLRDRNTFGDRITYAVDQRMTPMKPQISYVASYFGLSTDVNSYTATSLVSHSLCPVTAASLKTVFQGKNIPSAATIAKADRFSKLINTYRSEMLAGRPEGKVKVQMLWTKFMMCLSYMESLTTADSARADEIARQNNFRRPAGVSLYMDPYQTDPASKFNIGTYQLSAASGGIGQSCIREWNVLYPSCQIKRDASWQQMLWMLGSSLQTFNTFCGVSKVTAMFGVQVNSKKAFNTNPANVLSNGQLKAPAARCVSPFMNVNTSYNHFGPFQNVHGFTLDNVLTCTLKGE
jgi:hypothetical protein